MAFLILTSMISFLFTFFALDLEPNVATSLCKSLLLLFDANRKGSDDGT